MPDPEIDILWHGEWIIRRLMDSGCYHVPHEDMHHLELLVGELERIRLMRVAGWQQREQQKAARRRARLAQAAAGDRRVRELMRKAELK